MRIGAGKKAGHILRMASAVHPTRLGDYDHRDDCVLSSIKEKDVAAAMSECAARVRVRRMNGSMFMQKLF